MKRFLKRIELWPHRHTFLPHRYYYDRLYGNHYIRKTIWKCTQCGKEIG